MNLSYRDIQNSDLEVICKFPMSKEELFYMYPKAHYPFDKEQLMASISQRNDSIVIISDNLPLAFANFYEVIPNNYCFIGNVIVKENFRNQGIGSFLIHAMERIALEKYDVKEIHISCFNLNTDALIWYSHLGYKPYDIENRKYPDIGNVALIKMKYQIVD